jgi:hypothetical protein
MGAESVERAQVLHIRAVGGVWEENMTCKIIEAGREMRPEDLIGAKSVFVVGYATAHTSNGSGTFKGWWWYHGTEYVPGDDLYGPFKTEKAAQKHALANCTTMKLKGIGNESAIRMHGTGHLRHL